MNVYNTVYVLLLQESKFCERTRKITGFIDTVALSGFFAPQVCFLPDGSRWHIGPIFDGPDVKGFVDQGLKASIQRLNLSSPSSTCIWV